MGVCPKPPFLVSLTINPASTVLNAGDTQQFTVTGHFSDDSMKDYTTTVTDDGIPGTGLEIMWTKVSGPGNVDCADPTQPGTTASFSETGEYVLRLTASDSMLFCSDEVTIRADIVHRTYTTDVDFNEGIKVKLSSIVPDQHVPFLTA